MQAIGCLTAIPRVSPAFREGNNGRRRLPAIVKRPTVLPSAMKIDMIPGLALVPMWWQPTDRKRVRS